MNDDERRAGFRHARNEVIHVEVVCASHDQLDMGEVVSCATIDLSAGGLQITMDRSLPIGAILDLCVQLNGIPRQFFLTAEVRWCRPDNDGMRVGFQFFDSLQTDIETWRELFAD